MLNILGVSWRLKGLETIKHRLDGCGVLGDEVLTTAYGDMWVEPIRDPERLFCGSSPPRPISLYCRLGLSQASQSMVFAIPRHALNTGVGFAGDEFSFVFTAGIPHSPTLGFPGYL